MNYWRAHRESDSKDGVPRKTSEGYKLIAERMNGIDVLCTHESPILPEYQGRIHPFGGPTVLREIIEKMQPKLAFNGHLSGAYTIGRIGETISISIDSSQQEKHYAILKPAHRVVEIYNDYLLVQTITFKLDVSPLKLTVAMWFTEHTIIGSALGPRNVSLYSVALASLSF